MAEARTSFRRGPNRARSPLVERTVVSCAATRGAALACRHVDPGGPQGCRRDMAAIGARRSDALLGNKGAEPPNPRNAGGAWLPVESLGRGCSSDNGLAVADVLAGVNRDSRD